jgi:hypothetical protein
LAEIERIVTRFGVDLFNAADRRSTEIERVGVVAALDPVCPGTPIDDLDVDEAAEPDHIVAATTEEAVGPRTAVDAVDPVARPFIEELVIAFTAGKIIITGTSSDNVCATGAVNSVMGSCANEVVIAGCADNCAGGLEVVGSGCERGRDA